MAETQTTRFKLPQWSLGTDPYPGRVGWNNILKLLEDQAAIAFPSGPLSGRPQSGTFGRFYLANDQGTPAAPVSRLFYDSGSGWVELNTNGGGGPGTPIAINGTATEGTSSRSARADHVHSFPFATSGNPGALAPQHFDLLNGATALLHSGMLVRRTSGSQVVVPTTPGGTNDAASKAYVDTKTADIGTASHTVKPGELVRRWSGTGSNGTIHLPDPTAAEDGVNKRYADALGSSSFTGQGGKIVRRWGSEHVSGPDPDKPEFYATKRYVDGRVSRAEWKVNAAPIQHGLDQVVELSQRLIQFDYRNTEDVPASVRGTTGQIGAYVEDVARIMPGLTIDSEDDGRPERIREAQMVWPAIRAIGQLEQKVQEKDARIAALVTENAALNDRIHRIEGYLGL